MKKQQESFIQVIATDKKVASDIEQALLNKMMRELGGFLADEAKPVKRQKAKRGGK
jgi:hypothetical protein